MEEKITIKKLDETPTKLEKELVQTHLPMGGKRKTLKTFPRGILKTAKIKPVRDPAKRPPLKKGMKKHTIRVLTDVGTHARRKTIKHKLAKMSDATVREMVMKAGLSKGNAPPRLLREIAEGGMMAGFISAD